MQFIPYFQTTRYRVQAMLELAQPQPGEKMADLGAGDGRILMAFATAGIESHGFELDAHLLSLAKEHIRHAALETKASVHQKDFWQEDLSPFSIIAIYPMPDIMEALETKLRHELQPGSRVVLNYYPFANWKYTSKKDNIYLYHQSTAL